jgi:hypothetical protein
LLIPKAIACLLVFDALICGSQPASAQFVQRGPKLIAADAVEPALQGYSVALSTNGNRRSLAGTPTTV